MYQPKEKAVIPFPVPAKDAKKLERKFLAFWISVFLGGGILSALCQLPF